MDKLTRNVDRIRQFRSGRRGETYDAVNTSESGEITQTRNLDEFGFEQVKWTKLSGDVFKPPRCRLFFATLIGFGVQCTLVAACMVNFVTLGNLFNMKTRQYLYIVFFFITAFFGSAAGYFSARFYKFFNGTNWVCSFFTTAGLVPLLIFIASVAIDIGDYFDRNLRQIPSSERTNLLSLWFCFNFPFVAIGQWIGFRSNKIVPSSKPSRIYRPLPGCCEVPFYA